MNKAIDLEPNSEIAPKGTMNELAHFEAENLTLKRFITNVAYIYPKLLNVDGDPDDISRSNDFLDSFRVRDIEAIVYGIRERAERDRVVALVEEFGLFPQAKSPDKK